MKKNLDIRNRIASLKSPQRRLISMLLLSAATVSCQSQPSTNTNTTSVQVVASPSPTSKPSASVANKVEGWVGRWQGVEGTYLVLTKTAKGYDIVIANLDGPKDYQGHEVGDHIEFTRNGKTESIKAATGKETGMKYLAEKTDCVVVTVGSEGFCRK